MHLRSIPCFFVLLTIAASSLGQAADDGVKGATPQALAKNYFEIGDYRNALKEYQKLVAEKPEDLFYNYRVGLCHLNQNIDKSWSLPYLRKVVADANCDPEAYYDIGRAFMYNEQLDSAMLFFNKYKGKVKDGARLVEATRNVEFCTQAKKLMEKPLNVTFFNLGKDVNSEGPEFNAFIPDDESFIVYSTKRDKGVMGNNLDFDGYKPADVFWAKAKGGEFDKAKSVGATINTEWVEEITGLSANGEYMFLAIDNSEAYDDVWVSEFNGRQWSKTIPFGPTINTQDPELAASSSPDAQTLYFSRQSSAVEGFGGLDIYMAKKLPNGHWSTAVNLGPTVNTQYDDSYPQVSADGRTLYFSSMGHNSMGGYDVFKSEWDDKYQRWGRADNIGYPLNNTMDNFTFSRTGNMRYAYVSQLRKGGLGDLDIYRVTFNDIPKEMTVLVGNIELYNSPNKRTINLHSYTKDGQVKVFTDEYQPTDDPSWTYKETKKEAIKDGEKYEITIIGSYKGQVQKFTPENFPKDVTNFKWVDTRISKVKVPVVPTKIEPVPYKGMKEPIISIVIKDYAGKTVGKYTANRRLGRFVASLEPSDHGLYTVTMSAPGYETTEEKVSVVGMGQYKSEIKKTFKLVEKGLTLPAPATTPK